MWSTFLSLFLPRQINSSTNACVRTKLQWTSFECKTQLFFVLTNLFAFLCDWFVCLLVGICKTMINDIRTWLRTAKIEWIMKKKTNVNLGFYVKRMNILLCWMTLWQKQLLVWPQSHAHVTQNCVRPRERAEKKRGTGNEERVKRIVAQKKVIGIFNLMKLHSIKSENNSSIVLANIVE